ncbi:hypothetical protein [Hyphomicrobium sp.]|uniref:hypothetical protein n=1 Tax=Hyphomicrobium sp. TaxID=82 RepID=UPI001D84C5FC|nr:hypothetical protein [Hyphomicrobium sp.]MBY0561426.1 hypothetical protein [Hyphomicrobium sp.]
MMSRRDHGLWALAFLALTILQVVLLVHGRHELASVPMLPTMVFGLTIGVSLGALVHNFIAVMGRARGAKTEETKE